MFPHKHPVTLDNNVRRSLASLESTLQMQRLGGKGAGGVGGVVVVQGAGIMNFSPGSSPRFKAYVVNHWTK